MSTIPNLITRARNRVVMTIPENPLISGYRIRGHNTLDGAFAGGVVMFEVKSGTRYRSPDLCRQRLGLVEGSLANITKIVFDPDEFAPLSANLPTDQQVLYLTVEDYDIALGGYQPPSTILVIPNARYFGVQNSALLITGCAPGLASPPAPGDVPPTGALSFALPLYASNCQIKNLDPADDLLVSFDRGMGLMAVSPVSSDPVGLSVDDGSVVEVHVVSRSADPVDFTGVFSLTKV